MDWFFTVFSEEYGSEEYGPYDTEEEAKEGIERVSTRAVALEDDIERYYTLRSTEQ